MIRKQKNRLFFVTICLAVLLCITGCSLGGPDIGNTESDKDASNVAEMKDSNITYADENTEMSNEDIQKEIATFSYDNFEGTQEWRNGALLGDGQILSFGGPMPLYYTNLDTGTSIPFCAKSDCTHNNAEICPAIYSAHYGCDFVYCYNEKIYIASTIGNSIRIYRSDIDGTNHESVAYDVVEGNVSLSEYYVYDDCLYIALEIEDTNKEVLTDNEDEGYMTYNNPSIYRFDFATDKLKCVYSDEKGGYGSSVEILYGFDDVIYFTDGKEDGKVSALDITNGKVTDVEGYDSGYYLGCHGTVHYYAEWDAEGFTTGNIHVEDLEKEKESTIQLTTLPKDEDWYCEIHLLEDGFVINEASIDTGENATGTMTFYDFAGRKTDVVEDCSMYVVGEHQGFYLLSDYPFAYSAEAYATKEDVKLSDSKVRNKKVIYLYHDSE